MKPVTSALTVLQSENNTHMGCMLPTVFQLREKLQRMEATSKLCLPLLQALQEGLEKRFGEMMKDSELIAAAILLPKFKTSWTFDTQIIETENRLYFVQHVILALDAAELGHSAEFD
ncbi:uncharacterized protein LOC117594121 isoform X1 [Tachysurus ichikawai]